MPPAAGPGCHRRPPTRPGSAPQDRPEHFGSHGFSRGHISLSVASYSVRTEAVGHSPRLGLDPGLVAVQSQVTVVVMFHLLQS